MHRIVIALLAGLMLCLGYASQQSYASSNAPDISCDKKAIYDASTNGNTELVAVAAGNTVYICGYMIKTGGTGIGVSLVYGTGTACATGETALTPVFTMAANIVLDDSSPYYRGMKAVVSKAVCIKTDAAVAIDAIVYYTLLGAS